MNLGKIFLIIIFIALWSELNAQNLSIGFRAEPALVLTEWGSSNSFEFSVVSFYLNAVYSPFSDWGIEFRSGYFIGNEYYGGFEIGAYVKWKIPNEHYYLIAGVNKHSNDRTGGHNGGSGINKEMVFTGIGAGYQKDRKLGFDIMYYWTGDKVYSYSYSPLSSGRGKIFNEITGILKVSFTISFDII